jgi:hypothetical protein
MPTTGYQLWPESVFTEGEVKMSLFDTCCADIENEYTRLGHTIGWRFLSGPKVTLTPSAEIAFITLNPGGNDDPPSHPHASQEAGSAYRVESWNGMPPGQSQLQLQVGEMFKLLAERMGSFEHLELMDDTLTGHFIPFRSPSFKMLHSKNDSTTFAVRLWGRIFDHIAPRIVITMDQLTFKHIREIIRVRNPNHAEQHMQLPTGWGSYQADIVRFSLDGSVRTLVRIPHLSRFGIFTSNKCKQAVPRLMDEFVTGQWRGHA